MLSRRISTALLGNPFSSIFVLYYSVSKSDDLFIWKLVLVENLSENFSWHQQQKYSYCYIYTFLSFCLSVLFIPSNWCIQLIVDKISLIFESWDRKRFTFWAIEKTLPKCKTSQLIFLLFWPEFSKSMILLMALLCQHCTFEQSWWENADFGVCKIYKWV